MSSSRRGGYVFGEESSKKNTIYKRREPCLAGGEGLAVEGWFDRGKGTSPLKHGGTEGGGMLAGGGSGMHGQPEDPRRVGCKATGLACHSSTCRKPASSCPCAAVDA